MTTAGHHMQLFLFYQQHCAGDGTQGVQGVSQDDVEDLIRLANGGQGLRHTLKMREQLRRLHRCRVRRVRWGGVSHTSEAV